MKILIATDSFKGSLSSLEAGNAIADGIRRAGMPAEIQVSPIADGGEGTTEALVNGLSGYLETAFLSAWHIGKAIRPFGESLLHRLPFAGQRRHYSPVPRRVDW